MRARFELMSRPPTRSSGLAFPAEAPVSLKRTLAATVSLLAATATLAQPATAHQPTRDLRVRDCNTIRGGAIFVGASGKVGCPQARKVAARSVRGEELDGWNCTGVGTPFGKCNGKGKLDGSTVIWAVND